MTFKEIAYFSILGLPLFAIIGIIGFLGLILTAIGGILVSKGKVKISMHKFGAVITIILIIIHLILYFGSIYFN